MDTDHGIIVGVTAASGDKSDSAPFLELIEKVRKTVKIQAVTADAAYNFPLDHRVLHDQEIDFFVRPQKKFDRSAVEFSREKLNAAISYRNGRKIFPNTTPRNTGPHCGCGRSGARVRLPHRSGATI